LIVFSTRGIELYLDVTISISALEKKAPRASRVPEMKALCRFAGLRPSFAAKAHLITVSSRSLFLPAFFLLF
jgi:hypothetical protein